MPLRPPSLSTAPAIRSLLGPTKRVRAEYLVKAIRRPAGGSFGPPQTLSDSAQDGYEPAVAIAAGGQSAVVWMHVDEESHNRIQTSTSTSASGALSSPQTLSRRGSNGDYPAVAVSAGGQAVAVWTEAGIGEIAGGPVGSSFGPVTDLVPGVSQMEVAIDDAGDATAVWGRSESGDTIETATRSAAGAVAPSTIVSSTGDSFDASSTCPRHSSAWTAPAIAVVGWSRSNDGSAQANILRCHPAHAGRERAGRRHRRAALVLLGQRRGSVLGCGHPHVVLW